MVCEQAACDVVPSIDRPRVMWSINRPRVTWCGSPTGAGTACERAANLNKTKPVTGGWLPMGLDSVNSSARTTRCTPVWVLGTRGWADVIELVVTIAHWSLYGLFVGVKKQFRSGEGTVAWLASVPPCKLCSSPTGAASL